MTKSIESKLPDALKKEWLLYAAGRSSAEPDKCFDSLLAFLKSQESIYEQLDQLWDKEPTRKEIRREPRQARTRASNQSSSHLMPSVGTSSIRKSCTSAKSSVCSSTPRRLQYENWGAAGNAWRSMVRMVTAKLHSCAEILSVRTSKPQTTITTCVSAVGGSTERNYTKAQEEFFKKLSPELAQQCRDAFCNTVSRTSHVAKSHSILLAEGGLVEWPVIMMLLEVTANAGQKVGTLIDLASDTNYITHEAAGRLNLRSEVITLVVHGVGGMKVFVETRRYVLVSTKGVISVSGWPGQVCCGGDYSSKWYRLAVENPTS